MYNDVVLKKPKRLTGFLFFISQSHSFILIHSMQQAERQLSPALIIFKLYFGKTIWEKWKFYEFLVRVIKKLIRDSRITNP